MPALQQLTRDQNVHPRTACQRWVAMWCGRRVSCPDRLHRNTWQPVTVMLKPVSVMLKLTNTGNSEVLCKHLLRMEPY